MAYSSSDEESSLTLIPSSVTNYHFVTASDEPISFSALPSPEPTNSADPEVYLYGTTSDGLQKVYQPVVAWKLELKLRTEPEVFVEAKDGKWVKLLRPRKIYERIVRSVLITAQMLHFVKWNLGAGERSLWDHLRRVFDKFERRPSEEDLLPHFSFIRQFAEQDEALGKSQLLMGLLERKGRRRTGEGNSSAEVKESFIVADDEELILDNKKGNESDEEEEKDLFDSCCCICDNGGDLLCCEGECMRSFHATKDAGEESACRSLGMTKAQVDAIQNFLCKNCQVKQHQCFACGKLGNSDKSKGAEVFQCSNATCGYFYHASCVAKLLHPDDESKQSECEMDVVNGKFVCPAHRCYICKKLEVKKDYDLNFAVCRRCPQAYHRKCLPRKIAVQKDAEARGIITRAWDDLLPNRLLIYCLKHKIEEDLGTPIRNHIKFPASLENKEKNKVKELEKNKEKELEKYKEKETENNETNKPALEKRKRPLENEESPSERGPIKKRPFESEQKGLKKKNIVLNPNEERNKRIVKKKPQIEVNKGEGSKRQVAASDSPKSSSPRKIVKTTFPVISADTEKKIRDLYARESAKVTMEDVLKKRTIPLTHQNTGRQIEKVARGKIEGSVEAIQAAYQRITEGKSVDDAKALCEPEVVKQVAKWNKRLGVYLSPFLHGMRYTSFGRHFTKEEKLEDIVNKLQWYVQTDDTIVDFCCGANDFSRLMKQKMDSMGKKCNFKNYDIMWPQDDFCFEKRDWMTVQPKELPIGSSLIMGLNPPFGSKAALANKFIDKALTFKPKLLILIVPKETERLDKKRLGSTRYELIWEDNVSLSGKSFYLPGSFDENDNQMDQWNVSAPVLYLWSRSDWSARHQAVAEEQAHFSVFSNSSSFAQDQNGILGEENGILRDEKELEMDEREAGDIISQVVGDINIEAEEEGNNEEGNEGNNEELKGKEKVESDGEPSEKVVADGNDDGREEREKRREKGKKKKEEREKRREKGMEMSVGEAKRKKMAKETEGREKLIGEREREGGGDGGERRLDEERETQRRDEEREREKEAQRRAEEREAKRRMAEERERESEAKKRAEEREREKEAERKLAEEKEAKMRAEEEKEREKEAKKKLAEERQREKEAERKLAEERERKKEAERKLAEERERKKEAERKLAEERERELEAKMRAEEREEEKRRLTEQREREIGARRKRLAEEREAQRIERERENEAKRIEERQREIEAQRKAEEEKEREAQRRLSLERERENEARRRPSTERERESGSHFNRRRSSPTSSRERETIFRSPGGSRERGSTTPAGTSRERNNRPFDPRRRTDTYSDMEISPVRNNNRERNPIQNQPIETRHLDTINTTNNLLMESEPIESRHLSILPSQAQDDFSDLGPLFNNNNNEDIDEIAKRYSSGPNPSFNWSSIGSGSGFRSDYNRIHGSDFLIDNNNNRGFDDFNIPFNNPYSLGPIGPMSPIRSIHSNNSSSSYLSGFGGTGTSGSVTDRYAPRLDETNFLNRPGVPPVQGQFGNFGYGGLSGYDNVGAVRREMPPPPQLDQLGFRPDQLGFLARNPYRPPPGSSGGWIND